MKNKTTKTGGNKMEKQTKNLKAAKSELLKKGGMALLRDEENPQYIFQGTDRYILSEIVSGQIDPVALAKKELRNRGLNSWGEWVGFDNSERYWSFNLDKFVYNTKDFSYPKAFVGLS